MYKTSRNIILLSLAAVSFILMSWGYNGHRMINQGSAYSFTPEMEQFMSWAIILADHASDADYRKDEDPNEGPRHYIDIDNYPGFLANGKIPQSYDSVVAMYGLPFVIDNGILPWATKRTYDSLVSCFARFDWDKAVLFAADLGHYVGDAHNPLHITRNYNGQYTGNSGIHSRYETSMINAFQGEIEIESRPISQITNLNDYIFNYIYANYIYVDSIMLADNYAQGIAGNTSSYAYKAALWEKTRNFTIPLFNRAAQSLAELIYSAWVQAGRPDMNSGPGIFEFNKKESVLELKASPNPVKGPAKFHFYLPESAEIKLQIADVQGNILNAIKKENLPEGLNEFSFNLSELPEGIYFVSVETDKYYEAIKVIKLTY
jgi:hypothetical protein